MFFYFFLSFCYLGLLPCIQELSWEGLLEWVELRAPESVAPRVVGRPQLEEAEGEATTTN